MQRDHVTQRSARILAALCIATLIAILYTVLCSEDRSSMLFIGDLPGFYALGRIVLEGHGDHLYDVSYQQEVQNRFWPLLNNTFLRPLYPPFAAFYMAAFAWIPPIPLRCLIVLADILILLFAIRAFSQSDQIPRFSLIFFSLPIVIATVAAQNTIVSIGLLALARRLLETRRAFLSGVCAGLLLYKPQLGLLFAIVMAFDAGPYFILGAAITAIVQYLLGCWVYKGEWLLPWILEIQSFSALRATVDGFQMTSLVSHLRLDGNLNLSQKACELFICAICMLAVVAYSRGRRSRSHETISAVDLLAGVFPIFTPQIMFYDLGISIFWLFTRARLSSKRYLYTAIAIVVVVNACIAYRATASLLTPLAASLVALFYVLKVVTWRKSSR